MCSKLEEEYALILHGLVELRRFGTEEWLNLFWQCWWVSSLWRPLCAWWLVLRCWWESKHGVCWVSPSLDIPTGLCLGASVKEWWFWAGEHRGRNRKNSTLAPHTLFFQRGAPLCSLSWNANRKVHYYNPFHNKENSFREKLCPKEWLELILVVRIGPIL